MTPLPRYSPRHWEGVPGVRYPEPEPACPEPPVGWLTTAQAAAMLHVSPAVARQWLRRAGVDAALAAGKRLLWEPLGVMRAEAGMPRFVRDIPPGWCSAREACALLGCSRSSLARRTAGLTTMRARYRQRICLLYDRGQVRHMAAMQELAADPINKPFFQQHTKR